MEYTAEDYIILIENGRRDKISVNAFNVIAKRFRELEKQGQTLLLDSVSKHRELLIAYELENWEGSEVIQEVVEERVDEYMSNL